MPASIPEPHRFRLSGGNKSRHLGERLWALSPSAGSALWPMPPTVACVRGPEQRAPSLLCVPITRPGFLGFCLQALFSFPDPQKNTDNLKTQNGIACCKLSGPLVVEWHQLLLEFGRKWLILCLSTHYCTPHCWPPVTEYTGCWAVRKVDGKLDHDIYTVMHWERPPIYI